MLDKHKHKAGMAVQERGARAVWSWELTLTKLFKSKYHPFCKRAFGAVFARVARGPGCALRVQFTCLVPLAHPSARLPMAKSPLRLALWVRSNWTFF